MRVDWSAAHRPYPPPARPWALHMVWHDLLFMHWPLEPRAVEAALPPGIKPDLYEGRAWVGVVPFWMSGVRHRLHPPLPGLSRFPELNLRTYVVSQGRPGVYFFSLDAASRLTVWGARRFFHLNYFLARMRARRSTDGWVEYRSARREGAGPAARFAGRYRDVGAEFVARPGSLEHFLTERYCLYAADARALWWRCEIHHGPWRLRPAEAEVGQNTMAGASGIRLPATPPLLHFAARQDMVAWWKRPAGGPE